MSRSTHSPCGQTSKFLVMLDVGGIGAGKGFSDVPIPKLVGFLGCGWVLFKVQFFVRTNKKKVKVIFGPAGANLRSMAGHDFSERIFLQENRS